MRVHHAVVAALLVLSPHPLLAQDSLPRANTLVIGAGVNLDRSGRRTPAFLLGREWRNVGSRFSLRVAGEYTSSNSSRLLFDYNAPNPAPYGSLHTSSREASLSALTTFALATGRIQPYLISGLMLQKQFVRSAATFDPAATAATGPALDGRREDVYRSSALSLGAQAGVGLRARVGRGWVYSELRTNMPDALASQRAYPHRTSSPFIFGLQFE